MWNAKPMKLTPLLTAALTASALLFAPVAFADNKTVATEEMEAYLDFVDYGGATIFPEQIPKDDWKKFFVIDARDKDQFTKEHIPGAVNLREVFTFLATSSPEGLKELKATFADALGMRVSEVQAALK